MKRVWRSILLGLFVAGVGGAFAVVGWVEMEEVQPHADGVTATATVVDAVEGYVMVDNIRRRTYAPVYEFESSDGQRHRVTDHVTSSNRPPTIGSTVEVSYRPDDPSSVRRVDVDRGWLWWFVGGGLAVAACGGLWIVGALVASARGSSRR